MCLLRPLPQNFSSDESCVGHISFVSNESILNKYIFKNMNNLDWTQDRVFVDWFPQTISSKLKNNNWSKYLYNIRKNYHIRHNHVIVIDESCCSIEKWRAVFISEDIDLLIPLYKYTQGHLGWSLCALKWHWIKNEIFTSGKLQAQKRTETSIKGRLCIIISVLLQCMSFKASETMTHNPFRVISKKTAAKNIWRKIKSSSVDA